MDAKCRTFRLPTQGYGQRDGQRLVERFALALPVAKRPCAWEETPPAAIASPVPL